MISIFLIWSIIPAKVLISIFITSNHRFFSATLNSLWRFRTQTVITFKYHVTFFLILKCQWQRNGCISQKLTFNVELSEGWLVKKSRKSSLASPSFIFRTLTCESVGSYKTKWVIKAALHFLLATTDNFLPLQELKSNFSGSFNFILILCWTQNL